jgi:hypothetical protein
MLFFSEGEKKSQPTNKITKGKGLDQIERIKGTTQVLVTGKRENVNR